MKKIAVPLTREKMIDDHFGHCEYYGIYAVSDNNQMVDFRIQQSAQGCGCKSNIAKVLADDGVSIMFAGGIGAGAINVLNSWGIEVIRGCSGNADDVVKEYLAGRLADSGSSCQLHEQHHGHGESHSCHNN